MIEEHGDLWLVSGDAKCITTNGSIRGDGLAVMGRGVALDAKEMWPGVDVTLGKKINTRGNTVQVLIERAMDESGDVFSLVSFPVKRYWNEPAHYDLIIKSCIELAAMRSIRNWQRVILPRPGCGNGRLKWERVKPILQRHLKGDRFVVVNNE
jgi:hypothetical protein